MRLQPIGRDKDGLMYWYQLDQDHNVRMYIEEQDDQDGSSWKCIVRYLLLESFYIYLWICYFDLVSTRIESLKFDMILSL